MFGSKLRLNIWTPRCSEEKKLRQGYSVRRNLDICKYVHVDQKTTVLAFVYCVDIHYLITNRFVVITADGIIF